MSYKAAFTMSDTLRMILNRITNKADSFTEIKKQVKTLAMDTVWGEEKDLKACEIALFHACSTRSWVMLERHFRNACVSYGTYFDMVKAQHLEEREKGYSKNLTTLLRVVEGTSFEHRVTKALEHCTGTSAKNKLYVIEHELRVNAANILVKAQREKDTGYIAKVIPEGATHYSKRDGGSFFKVVDNHVSEWFWDEWIRVGAKSVPVDVGGIWRVYELFGGGYSIFRKAVNGLIENFPYCAEDKEEAENMAMRKNQTVFTN